MPKKSDQRWPSWLRRIRNARATGGEQGQTMVEFALCAMLLLTFVFGILDFGLAVFSYNFISNAAREGTRYAMVHGATCASSGVSCALSSQQIQNYVVGLLPGAMNANSLTVTATCGPSSSSPPVGDCGAGTNDNPGNVVYVQVKYIFSFFPSLVLNKQITMQTASQRVIWQ
jgi:Flp pilus assembly protein TadG